LANVCVQSRVTCMMVYVTIYYPVYVTHITPDCVTLFPQINCNVLQNCRPTINIIIYTLYTYMSQLYVDYSVFEGGVFF
jgi:hypothetical protein